MTMNRSASALLGPERRFAPIGTVEIRAEGEAAIGFTGHAAVFGKRAWIGPPKWGFWEQIRKGAFAKTIRESDVRQLQNHDPNYPLARSTVASGPGSLRLSEDEIGLNTDADWIATTYARDLALAVSAGVVTQQSFSFLPVREEWSTNDEGDDVRELIEVNLFDVSPVVFPAYDDTDASLRALSVELDEAEGVPPEQRKQLVRSYFSRVPTSDLALALRAALNAPAEPEDNGRAPAPATHVQGDLLALESELRRRRMRRYAALAPEWQVKGATTP